MSTGAAIGAAASAQAAAAMAEAERARCTAVIKTYKAETASLVEMRDYSKCVFTVYGSGEPLDPTSALVIKVLIVVSLLAGGVGAWRGWGDDGMPGALMFGFFGSIGTWIVAFVIGLIIYGVGFVLS